jgi:hypothetical protein
MDTTFSLKLPPKNYRRIIEELSVVIPDPALKLKFLKQAINEHQKISAPYKLYPPIAGIAFRKKLLDNAEKIWPGSKKAVKNRIRKGVLPAPGIRLPWPYKFRYVIASVILTLFIGGVGTAVSPLVRYFNFGTRIDLNFQQVETKNLKIVVKKPIFYSHRPKSEGSLNASIVKPAKYQNEPELVLEYFQNPVLMALTSHQVINSAPEPTSLGPVLISQTPESGNQPPSPTVKPAKYQLKSGQDQNFLQKPVLAALTASSQNKNATSDRIPQRPIVSSRPPEGQKYFSSPAVKIVDYQIEPELVPEYLQKPIWLVEKTSDRETYSNRLQIITTHTISNIPREYYRFSKNSDHLPANSKITDEISGIVYHASESDLYPFMPEMNRSILKYSKQLIKYLLRQKSYHFFIDRFGRVYRLVQEDHAAFHAGNSIWADDEEIYLNLNHAFIGICFEGKDFEEIDITKKKKDQSSNSKSSLLKPTGISTFNEAQLRSGKELTDWLRVKYKISQHNCVPHALISVNPDRMLIGFHLDLSRGFPFAKFGLSDKYQEPLPSMVEFGFLYDRYFEKIFNGQLWRGIHYSEEILQRQAGISGMSFAEYRKSLHRRFSRYTEWKNKMLEKKDQVVIKLQKTMGKEDRLSLGGR